MVSAGFFNTEEADDGNCCADNKATKPKNFPFEVDLLNGELTSQTEQRRSDAVSKQCQSVSPAVHLSKRPTPRFEENSSKKFAAGHLG